MASCYIINAICREWKEQDTQNLELEIKCHGYHLYKNMYVCIYWGTSRKHAAEDVMTHTVRWMWPYERYMCHKAWVKWRHHASTHVHVNYFRMLSFGLVVRRICGMALALRDGAYSIAQYFMRVRCVIKDFCSHASSQTKSLLTFVLCDGAWLWC